MTFAADAASQGFVHLGARSEASLGESLARVEELCWEAARDEQGWIALTDVNSLARCPAFEQAARHAGLRPVFGVELSVLPYRDSQYRGSVHRVRLLAENGLGWKSLIRLVNEARRNEGPTRPPYVTFASVLEDLRGLLVFLGGAKGELTALLRSGDLEVAEGYLRRVADRSEPGALYLELPEPAIAEELAGPLRAAAKFLEMPIVAVPMVTAATAADAAVLRFFRGDFARPIDESPTVAGLFAETEVSMHLVTRKRAGELYTSFPDALAETVHIAERCAGFSIPQPDRRFPVHDFNRGVDAESFIWNSAFARATERYGDLPTRYKERLDREFREIVAAGLANAVVSLSRLQDELEAEGVQCGPGAGLFTNSVIASLLGLTRLDPLKFDLAFDLEPGIARGSFPLLEVSIPGNQEKEAATALGRLFDNQTTAVGEWKCWKPQAIMDRIAEILGKDGRWATGMLKNAAFQKVLSVHASTQPSGDLALDSSEVIAWLIHRMEGRLREVVIAPGLFTFSTEPLDGALPLRVLPGPTLGAKGTQVSEWTSEELGRIRHGRIAFAHSPLLDLIGEATALAREQGEPHYTPERTDPDDAATYRLISEGGTAGIAPLESPLIRKRLRQGQPGDLHAFLRLMTSPLAGETTELPDLPTLLLCHVCAAIKAHRPAAFLAAALTQAAGDARRTGMLLEEVHLRTLPIAPVDINYSGWRWSASRAGLRAGFIAIRHLGNAAASEILAKRREMHFADLVDLCTRTDRSRLKPNHLRALLAAGALDPLGESRPALRHQLDDLTPLLKGKKSNLGDASFFGQDDNWFREQTSSEQDTATQVLETPEQLAREEREALGFCLADPELRRHEEFLRAAQVRLPGSLNPKLVGKKITLLAAVGPLAEQPGSVLVDACGCLATAQNGAASALRHEGIAGERVLLTGILERETFQWTLDVEAVVTIRDAGRRAEAGAALVLDLEQCTAETLKELKALLKKYPGQTPVQMTWLPAESPRILRSIASRTVLVCPLLERELTALLSPDHWKIELRNESDKPVPAARQSAIARIPGMAALRRLLSV